MICATFQSTHPVRGASETVPRTHDADYISIHAPREGCDMKKSRTGERIPFQSTHPVRGATSMLRRCTLFYGISIHAPREGCDVNIKSIILCARISIHAPREGCDARMDFISQNMDTPPIPRHQLYRTIHPHFPRYANPLNRYASRSLTLELSNDKKNTHRPQKP